MSDDYALQVQSKYNNLEINLFLFLLFILVLAHFYPLDCIKLVI